MIRVVNMRSSGEYIGRGSPLGNPFTHKQGTKARWIVGSRDEAVDRYREWIQRELEINPRAQQEFERLLQIAAQGDLNLRCFCAPLRCHGDVLKEMLEAELKARFL